MRRRDRDSERARQKERRRAGRLRRKSADRLQLRDLRSHGVNDSPSARQRPEADRRVRGEDDPDRDREDFDVAGREEYPGDDAHRLLRVIRAVAEGVERGGEELQGLVEVRLPAAVRPDHDGERRQLESDLAQRSVARDPQLAQHRDIPLAMANSLAQILMLLIALLHFYFLVLEMFLWRTRARKLFGMTTEKAEATAQLAQNQTGPDGCAKDGRS